MPLPRPEQQRVPLRPSAFPNWADYYWEYQHRLAREYLVPQLEQWGAFGPGCRVLDVGCGDGGASCAMAEAGAQVDGFDLDGERAAGGAQRARARGHELHLGQADITDPATLEPFAGPYDLVCFRDVLEHIPGRDAAVANSVARLSPGGAILLVYPPYLSAYGGHQQILPAARRLGVRWGKLPWVHLLPRELFRRVAGVESDHHDWQEILTIREAHLTLGATRALGERHGLEVVAERRYLLRPTFRLRYGTPVVGAGPLGLLPGLSELLVMGACSLLRRRGEDAPGFPAA